MKNNVGNNNVAPHWQRNLKYTNFRKDQNAARCLILDSPNLNVFGRQLGLIDTVGGSNPATHGLYSTSITKTNIMG